MQASFDTVVVGAGSAGCVVAARLAANSRHRVAVIEAGPDFGPLDSGRWPAELLDASRDAMGSYTWGFPGGVAATRGKVVGGCSAINGCGILAGLANDYDAWSPIAPGWSADALAPYLERAEREIRARVTAVEDLDPWRRRFYDAALELDIAGRPRFDDGNGDDAVGPIAMNTVGTMRINAAFAYLDPLRRHTNLEIMANTLVDRVVVNGRQVVGVSVLGPENEYVIRARQVVVSAGAYGAPAILVRSGIGPRRVLDRAGTKPLSVLPGVGEGLRDHPLVDVPLVASQPLRAKLLEHAARSHPLAQVLVRRGHDGVPWELQLGPWSSDLAIEGGRSVPFGYCGITVTLATPRSLGRVLVSSCDPSELPLVQHGFLSDPGGADAADLLAGVEFARALARTASISAVASMTQEHGALSVDGLRAWIADTVVGNFHPVGTCRMGTKDDPMAVVESSGRVFGVEGLRVIDASILPGLPRANTHLTVLAVAERLAEALVRDTVI